MTGGTFAALAEPRQRRRFWRRWGRTVLDWWLVRLKGHSLFVHLGVSLTIWVILLVTFDALDVTDSPFAGPGTEAVIVAFSLFLPPLLTFIALRQQIKLTFALLDVPARSVPVMRRIVAKELSTLDERISRLRCAGLPFHPDSIPDWLRRTCFSGACGAYLAVDTLTPSEFVDCYGELLVVHQRYLVGGAPRSVRINVSSRSALHRDAYERSEQYNEYVSWHLRNGVTLLHCAPDDAAKIAHQHGLDEAPADVGLWVGELALMAITSERRTRVQLGLVDESLYERVDGYVRELIAHATPLWP